MTSEQWYATHSDESDPGRFCHLFKDLPRDIPGLCTVSQGLFIHVFHASKYGVMLSETSLADISVVRMEDILEHLLRIDDAPLQSQRPPDRRMASTCRDYALFLCATLRERGVPARVRAGFESYFHKDRWGDHWVCEHWDPAQGRWIVVDAQLDTLHREAFKISFEPTDLSPEHFVNAGVMWRRCREGLQDPSKCGMLTSWGMPYVRANVVRDLACCLKIERFPWDSAALIEKDEAVITVEDLGLLDRIAGLLETGPDLEALRALHARHPELHHKPMPVGTG
jgi:hypothetical protein